MNPAISSARVSRKPLPLNQAEYDRAAVARHQAAQKAAHHVMDVIDRMMREEDRLKAAGPRTATHPMATRLPPDVPTPRPPMATRAAHFIDPSTIRLARRVTMTLGWMVVFMAGIAVGKSL